MDDLKIWMYVIVGGIYLVTRMMKNRNKPSEGGSTPQDSYGPSKQPKSFEELLREFTEDRKAGQVTEQPQEAKKHVPAPEVHQEEYFEEGRTRSFSDEESRKIYEDSIKSAEKTDDLIKSREAFQSRMKREIQQQDTPKASSDILDMLRNPEDARKAVVLAEILNRKY